MITNKATPYKKQNISESAESIRLIEQLHKEILEAARTSLPKAIKIGRILSTIKAKLEHGQWLPWIEKHLPFAGRTATRYIKCFEERDRLKSDSVSDLAEAYDLLTEPKPAPAPASRFAELDGKVMHSLNCIDEILPCLSKIDLAGETIVPEPDFQAFIHEKGIALADGDLISLSIIGRAYEKGVTVTAGAIIDTLKHFNPTRTQEATA